MYFNLSYDDNGNVTDIVLKPGINEEADKLHDYSCILKVKNPALDFSEMAKAGVFDEITDEEYEKAITKIKDISKNCFDNSSEVNIFRLVVALMKHIMCENMEEVSS